MNEEDSQLLQRIAQRLDDHVDRYERDHGETLERIRTDKIEQKQFRDGIAGEVAELARKIDPIANDHNRVKWLVRATGISLLTAAGGWAWDTIKSHLK